MGDLNVIDRFMETFIRYIDSGFGLLTGDVAFLTTILIGIDITLAGLFWAMDGEANIFGRSEEHTSELQSLMRISYAVFCLKKKKKKEKVSADIGLERKRIDHTREHTPDTTSRTEHKHNFTSTNDNETTYTK